MSKKTGAHASTTKPYPLHLIEPTLHDQAGHGYSYTTSLIQANEEGKFKLTVWIDKRGRHLLDHFNCQSEAYFVRKFRQIQKFFLYRKLLKNQENIFINTAEYMDIKICQHLLKTCEGAKVFLHFHQFTLKNKKLDFLRKIKDQENLIYLATTPGLLEVFKKAGIKNTYMVPCSSYPPPNFLGAHPKMAFEKVIFAGAARHDKGFSEVVDLIAYSRETHKKIRFEIQSSAPSSGRYDEQTRKALEKLKTIQNPNLSIQKSTLATDQYLDFFENSICLLLYDVAQYHNKFSGVALDAFNNGCPVITGSHTWMGDTVTQYQAGVVVEDYKPATVLAAIETIIQNYEKFSSNAFLAGEQLAKIHNPKYTLDIVGSSLQTSN